MTRATFWLCDVAPVTVYYEELIEGQTLLEITGLSMSVVARAISARTFPRALKINEQTYWVKSEVEAWVEHYRGVPLRAPRKESVKKESA